MKQMVKVFVAAAMVLAFAVPASAQGTGNGAMVQAGLSFLHFDGFTPKGLDLEIAKAIKSMSNGSLDIVGDVAFHSDNGTAWTFAAGPRMTFAGNDKVKAFVQVLVGGIKFPEGSTDLTFLPGGGVMFMLNGQVYIYGQVDFQYIKFDGGSENATRFTFGVAFPIGG